MSVPIGAKDSKEEEEVLALLKGALAAVREDEGTIDCYALKVGKRDFVIFNTFGSEKVRPAPWRARSAER